MARFYAKTLPVLERLLNSDIAIEWKMEDKGISYREVKLRQQKDLRSKAIIYDIYRNFSTPFTYAFVKLGISPNMITLLGFFLYLIGAYLLSLGTYFFFILGFLFFIINRILDDCDGEVARIQNSLSIEGVYFDRISHYILSLSLGLGFGFGLYRLYHYDIYLAVGFIFALVMILDNAMKDLIKSLLRENIMKVEKKLYRVDLKKLDKGVYQGFMQDINRGRSWEDGNLFSKLFSISPFQGLIYTETFIIPILLVLTIIEWLLATFLDAPVIFGYGFGVMSVYILIVIISKIIWIVSYISKIEKNRHITKIIKEFI